VRVEVVEDFGSLTREFRDRAGYPNVSNFFLSLQWFENLYETSMSQGEVPRIYIASDEAGRPLGVFYGMRGARGRVLSSMTNFYSMEFAPVVLLDGETRMDVVDAIADYVCRERPVWSQIDIRLLRSTDPATERFVERLRAAGYFVGTFFQYENWYVGVEGVAFDEYFSRRPSRLRNTVTRKSKQANKQHVVEMRCVKSDCADLASAVDAYERIYASSWKNNEAYPDFMRGLARTCARLGILRLGQITVDGTAAAAQFWITSADRALIYKLAYDEKFQNLSVGSLLSTYMFRGAMDEDGVAEIDYGVGSEPYKHDWMAEVRVLNGMLAHNPRTVSGLIGIATELGARGVRGFRRRRQSNASESANTGVDSHDRSESV
jgi:hypothetical protein